MLEHVTLKVRRQISCAAITMPHSAGDRGDPIGDPCACKARACSTMAGTPPVQMRTCRVALPLRLPRKMRSCCALSFKSIVKLARGWMPRLCL